MDRLVEEKVETLVETKKEEPLKESKKVVLHKEKIEAQTETAKEEKVETQVAEPKVETSAAHEEKIENKELKELLYNYFKERSLIVKVPKSVSVYEDALCRLQR